MGAIQSAINRGITSVSVLNSLRQEPVSLPKMKKSIQSVEEQKLARAKQRAQLESYKAKYQEAKLKRKQAMVKQREMRLASITPKVKIGGEDVSDPTILKRIKEVNNG